jgi:hypothetical protein
MSFVSFIDIISANIGKAPIVRGSIRAYYITGSPDIEATAAQIAAAKAGGMGIVLIDQTRSLSLFAAGLADVADVESGAAIPQTAAAAVEIRQSHTWASTLYVGNNDLAGLKASIGNQDGVLYAPADYSWSQAEAEQLLDDNADWAYCQFGDNITNAQTLVPGTSVTCGKAGCDIDVAKASWAAQFMIVKPSGVVVPAVEGMRVVAQAIPALAAEGLTCRTNPAINPAGPNVVVSQTPGAGKRVARGSNVDLGIKLAS